MARILIVDDEAVNRELIVAFLEGSGHTLLEADSGTKALALAKSWGPDLVLLDVRMPDQNGFEVTRQLKERAGQEFLPVILVTALSDRKSRVLGLQMGADDCLPKPVDQHELRVRVHNLLALRAKGQALALKNAELVALHRFHEEMATLIVHDLKNPMSIIVGNLSFLMRKLGDKPELQECVDDCQSATKRVLRLITNILDVARMEANRLPLKRATVSLGKLLTTLAEQRAVHARAQDVTIETALESDLAVDGDADLLARVLENIVDNAFRHVPAGGRVGIAVSISGGHAHVRIGNTGSVIPTAKRERIFDKFVEGSVDGGHTSLGLGLYFCRLAIEAHGGRIWVESTPAFSAEFVVELPLSKASPAP